MEPCKLAHKKDEITAERKPCWTWEKVSVDPDPEVFERRFVLICEPEEDPCPTPLAAQNLLALRSFLHNDDILITWSDPNGFPIEEPQSHNGYTLEHKNHPDDLEWMLIGTVYPGNGWPGADDPIIEFVHQIMGTHDATRIYRVRAFNHCGNYSTYVTVVLEPPYEGYLRIWNTADTAVDEFMYFAAGEYGEINAKERLVKTAASGPSAVNWYVESINWGTGAANWFYMQENSTGAWVQLLPGSGTVYPHYTKIRVICYEENPGDRNAFVTFKTMAGNTITLEINTTQV